MTHTYRSSKEIAALVRQQLKAELPQWKFSVTFDTYSGGSSIDLVLMAGPEPVTVDGNDYAQLNHYPLLRGEWQPYNNGAHLTPQGWQVMKQATETLAQYHWDESDIQTDYFNCAFYMHVAIGKWDKGYQVRA